MLTTTFELMYKIEEKHWWFSGRRFLVQKLLKNYFINTQEVHILDAGCGTGLLDHELKEKGIGARVVGFDSSPDAVRFSQQRGNETIEGSLEKLPFMDNLFDAVLLLDVIEHVFDERIILAEMHRVLKKNGLLIIFAPAFRLWWSRQDELLGHYRRYRISDLRKLFDSGEWSVLDAGYFNFCLALPILIARKVCDMLGFQAKDEITRASAINPILKGFFKLELRLLQWVNFPFGVSVFMIIKKDK